jgi:branched-chain amino acid transport system permease protein
VTVSHWASRPGTSIRTGEFRLKSLAISVWPLAAGIGLAGVMQFVLPQAVGAYYSRIVLDAGIAMMLAVSLNIVNGMTGQFSIGHAGFMALGGYTAGFLTYYGSLWLWDSPARHGGFFGQGEWLFAASCLVGGLVAAAAGYVVGLPSLRLRGDYLAIVTLGFGEILRVLLQQTNNVLDDWSAVRSAPLNRLMPPPVGGSVGFDGIPKYSNLFWVYAFLAVTVIASHRLKRSSLGRGMIAVREDEIAAQAMGVNLTRQKVRAFVLAALFAGMAGGLFAHEKGILISPRDAGFQRSFDYVIMTVLGGRGSITGVMLAASILSVLPEFLREFDQYRLIVFALVLIVMMVARPQGLFGIHEIWDFLPRRRKGLLGGEAATSVASKRDQKAGAVAGSSAAAALCVEKIGISFGGLTAVQNFSLELPPGALVGLIGPNGAGKTTVFNLLTGVYRPDTGQMRLGSQSLIGRKAHEITACGIARTFQNIRLFANLSVLDNVRIAAQLRGRHGLLGTLLRTPAFRAQEESIAGKARALLALFGLQTRAFEGAGGLSYGHQRHLEIVRALATEPHVLLLDEPAAGLNHEEKRDLARSIREIRDGFGVSILLIDHDMQLVMDVCERIVVLDYGVTIAEGPPDVIRKDRRVIVAYLGEE